MAGWYEGGFYNGIVNIPAYIGGVDKLWGYYGDRLYVVIEWRDGKIELKEFSNKRIKRALKAPIGKFPQSLGRLISEHVKKRNNNETTN